mmetsp:Transcript_27338/g.41318  ORF Transcript_27338/g.41318 Transcript_27338/m.41318 type:complete len:105 (-) Transcript_27338:81-395(-)
MHRGPSVRGSCGSWVHSEERAFCDGPTHRQILTQRQCHKRPRAADFCKASKSAGFKSKQKEAQRDASINARYIHIQTMKHRVLGSSSQGRGCLLQVTNNSGAAW